MPCLTDAPSKARASPFLLESNRNMEVRAATETRVSLGIVASDLPLEPRSDPQSATTPCLTDAPSKARASPFLLETNRNMEVRVAMEARVSLGMLASDPNLGSQSATTP
jgi:hypothetical protein